MSNVNKSVLKQKFSVVDNDNSIAFKVGSWPRIFSTAGVHPFDSIKWKTADARITKSSGEIVFEAKDIEVPDWWNQTTINVVADKYFRVINGIFEKSVKQVFTRVVKTIRQWATEQNYFNTEDDAQIYEDELLYALVHQYGAFNSPVWFNLGVPGRKQAASACFISEIDDTLESIMNFQKAEVTIFASGSGSGANYSSIRSSYEKLSSGSYTSGPMSWMRGLDQYAGAMKSGGSTRAAAKMAILNMSHPDILETRDGRPGFIRSKSVEEKRAHDLISLGYSSAYDDPNSAYKNVMYQNANHSVSIPDDFMEAVIADGLWETKEVLTGKIVNTYKARDLWAEISKSAWFCGDPGVQFSTTMNKWHTTPVSGTIVASNPCSEYLNHNNTACNLCAINLTRFFNGKEFLFDRFEHSVNIFATAQMAIIGKAEYPTKEIKEGSDKFRSIGINYGDLGALLMKLGFGYDSDEGRAVAARLASLMTGIGYGMSAKLAARVGAFPAFKENKNEMLNVMGMHQKADATILKRWNLKKDPISDDVVSKSAEVWEETIKLGRMHGYNVSQCSLMAPLGCLVAGSMIATNKGLVRIEDLGNPDGDQWQDVDFEVQTDSGPKKATKFYVNGIDDIVEITTKRGYKLRGTPRHQIKVVSNTGEWVWKRFDEIEENDIIPLSLDQLIGEPQVVELPSLPKSKVQNFDRGVKVPSELDGKLAELVGVFSANGSSHHKGLRFAVVGEDKDVIEKYSSYIFELFGKQPSVTVDGKCVSICLNSTQIVSWWASAGFAKVEKNGKLFARIPDQILAANDKNIYGSYLRGLFTCDGSTNNGRPNVTNKSLDFIMDVQNLMLAIGIPTKIDNHIGGFSKKPVYRVSVVSLIWNEKFEELIGFSSARKTFGIKHVVGYPQTDDIILNNGKRVDRYNAKKLLDVDKSDELRHALSFYYDKVENVESNEREVTYDISVPENVTYIANGFVSHNTISYLMGMSTTGIEPAFSLVSYKSMVGGGFMKLVNSGVREALSNLNYDDETVNLICKYIEDNGFIENAPGLNKEHLHIFDCAMPSGPSERYLTPLAHMKMMAAIQPLITCAQSKTVNLPNSITPEEIGDIYLEGWKMGLKCIALYRDGCKVSQPLSTKKEEKKEETQLTTVDTAQAQVNIDVKIIKSDAIFIRDNSVESKKEPDREHMPSDVSGWRHKFDIDGYKGYIICNQYPDGRPGEVFLKLGKSGSTIGGVLDGFTRLLSICLQYGIPLPKLIESFVDIRFEPSGMTQNKQIRFTKSIYDYLFKVLDVRYFDGKNSGLEDKITSMKSANRDAMESIEKEPQPVLPIETKKAHKPTKKSLSAPPCNRCGSITVRSGSCHLCPTCGTTTGCS